MIHSRPNRPFTAVVLSFALMAACTCAYGDASIATPTRPVNAAATVVVSPTPTGTSGVGATTVPLTQAPVIELVGYLGSDQARAVSVQGDYAYVGFDIQLAVVDISDPGRPQRVGYVVLPNTLLDIAVAGSYAYVATGYDGLHIVDVSDPSQPAVLDTYYASSHVNGVVVDGSYAYVSNGALRIMDLSAPAAPVEIGAYNSSDPMNLVGKVAAAVGDYAYTIFHGSSSKSGGMRIVDVCDPTTPIEVGTFVTGSPVRDAAVAGDYAYLLAGQGVPRLVIVDISDPEHPVEVHLDPTAPWLGQSLAVADGYVYLACPDSSGLTGHLRILDVTGPAHPVPLGLYEGLPWPVGDIVVGSEWAHIATGQGLAVVSVSDPTAPAITGFYHPDAVPRTSKGVSVSGDYAYVAGGEDGLHVLDVSDPADPRVVSGLDTAGHAWDIALDGGYAYLADETNGLRVISITDPLRPVEVGLYDIPGAFEFFHGVAVAGAYAYVADGGLLDTGLRVVDISDPTTPTGVAFLPLSAAVEDLPPRAEDVAVANGYVYLAAGTAGMRAVDVSDPAAPREIGFYDTPGRTDSLAVVGRYAYVADGDLRIVDVANPAAPSEVGFYDIPGFTGSIVSVVVQDSYAYVTSQGVWMLDVSDPGAPVEVGEYPIAWGNVAMARDTVYVIGNGLFILRSLRPDQTLMPRVFLPPVRSDKCETHTADMTLTPTATVLEVGEMVTVTATLANVGCTDLGMPQYRLSVQCENEQPILEANPPTPILHLVGIHPGESDAAEFVLRAVGPGEATLSGSASFEVHLGYPGPAYWGGRRAGRLVITVMP